MPSEIRVDKISSTTSPYDPVFSTTGGALSHRNIIINGDMRIAQRGTSVTGVTGIGYKTVDRFNHSILNAGTWTMTQESSGGTDEFPYSLKMECTTADTSLGSGDYFLLQYNNEGQDLQHFQWGTANAKPITFSFWIKSNKTGTAQLTCEENGGPPFNGQTFTIDSADTWEKKVLTFSGNTSTAINNTNGKGIEWQMWFGIGSNFTSTNYANDTWHSTSGDRASESVDNWADTVGNYIQITGVQLELGTVATPFEHRSYGEELARCQRYYQRLPDASGSGSAYASIGTGYVGASTQADIHIDFKTAMRASPAFAINGCHIRGNGFAPVVTSHTSTYFGSNTGFVVLTASSGGMATGNAVNLRRNNSNSDYIELDAEL